MLINIIPKNKIQNGGYTMTEALAVIAIIGVMSAVFIADYSSNRQNIFLKQAVGQVIADLRTAQNMAMNTAKFNGQIPLGGYGVHFNSPPSSSYIIYADVDGQNDYDAGEEYAVRSLSSGIAISAVTASDIDFIPPDPKICFDKLSPIFSPVCAGGGTAVFSATITLRSGSAGPAKTITVNGITGQITGN
jgi:type II secretory pathway pseudopilin PulG